MRKKIIWTALLALGGIVLALSISHVGATASSQPKGSPLAAAGAGSFANTGSSPHGAFGRGAFARVTGVSGNTITANTWNNGTITIAVSGSTTYHEAGVPASLSDVHTGSAIAVQGTWTGTTAISATAIDIILPRAGGTVAAVSGSSITVSSFNGATQIIHVDSNTHYDRAGKSASLSDITRNTRITAEGNTNKDGSLQAIRIEIVLPRVAGQVTAVNGSSFAVSRFMGPVASGSSTTVTVTTSSSTTFVNKDGTAAGAGSVKVGTFMIAEGTLSSDGKTLQADRVMIAPAAAAPGTGGWHGLGRFRAPFRGGPFGAQGFRPAPGGIFDRTPNTGSPNA